MSGIREIDRDELNEVMVEEHGLVLDLPEGGLFYELTDQLTGERSICWTGGAVDLGEDTFSLGLELLRFDERSLVVSPVFLDFLRDVPSLEITSKKLLDAVTKGKSIRVNRFEKYSGEPIVLTFFGHRIAFGTVDGDEFVPLIDVGQYLREGQ